MEMETCRMEEVAGWKKCLQVSPMADDVLRAPRSAARCVVPAGAFSRTVPVPAELSVAQSSNSTLLLASCEVFSFADEASGVVVPRVDVHERVIAANGQQEFSQSDHAANATIVRGCVVS